MDVERPDFEQEMVTGHDPGVVLAPTSQVHDTTPELPAVFSPSPAAVEDPDLYSTSIEHLARAAVLTAAVAFEPALIGDVSVVNVIPRVVLGVGTAVGSGVAD